MYKCMITNKQSRPGEKLNKIVVLTRNKIYSQKIWEDDQLVDVEVGRGYETVKEINASEEGLDIWNSWSPEDREEFAKSL